MRCCALRIRISKLYGATTSLLPASSPWRACNSECPNPRADSGREKDRMRGPCVTSRAGQNYLNVGRRRPIPSSANSTRGAIVRNRKWNAFGALVAFAVLAAVYTEQSRAGRRLLRYSSHYGKNPGPRCNREEGQRKMQGRRHHLYRRRTLNPRTSAIYTSPSFAVVIFAPAAISPTFVFSRRRTRHTDAGAPSLRAKRSNPGQYRSPCRGYPGLPRRLKPPRNDVFWRRGLY